MTETQKRIRAYQKALPHMKERVIAVAVLLAMSIAMMTSASFAWLTLSRAPEVNGLATTVSTNGNLEIALSGANGLQPAESTALDGLGNITSSNLTWGNLINLSDPSYGLDKIILRPASLDPSNLLTSPMNAVEYDSDGRIKDYITEFSYTSYDSVLKAFGVTKDIRYGVRAISSVTYKDISGNQFLVDQLDRIQRHYGKSNDDFKIIYENSDYMNVIGKLVEVYSEVILQSANPDVTQRIEMATLLEMVEKFSQVVDEIGKAYTEIANLRYYQTLQDASLYDPFELSDLTGGKIDDKYTTGLTYLSNYLAMYSDTQYALKGVQSAADAAEQSQPVLWKTLAPYVNKLCKMDTATVNGYTVNELLSAIHQAVADSDIGFITGLLGWDKVPAVINDGALKDIDQFLNGQFFVPSGTIEITVVYPDAPLINRDMELTLHPYVSTAASSDSHPPYYLNADIKWAEQAATGGTSLKGDAVAAETYAMAIDLWVRTNQEDALLILEGEVIYAQATGTNADGQSVGLLYSYTTVDPQTKEAIKTYLYKDSENNWFYDNSYMGKNDAVPATDVPSNIEPVYSNTPIGYEGVNRVWNELDNPNSAASAALGGDPSITQGSGSCYVFYYESADDRDQCLKLLSAMQVAFVDEEGTLLGKAFMDTANAVLDAGRVTVPLQMYEQNVGIALEEDGEMETRYITQLTRNQAKRITALVYLDGSSLSNTDVLAAGSITGQLNLQFGTSQVELDAMDDPVMSETYAISFIRNNYSFLETDTVYDIDLQMTLRGLTPRKVTGNFVSVVNANQGAKQPTFELVLNPVTGYYEATVSFAGPGNYQLRSVQIDGVDYMLEADQIVRVTVPGERVTELRWGDDVTANERDVLTADSYYQQSLHLTLRKSGNRIATVRAVFLGNNGSNVTVNFTTTDGENYTGTANFSASDTYQLTYVYINNKIASLDSTLYKTLNLSLGLRTEIRLATPYFDEGVSAAEQEQIMSQLVFTRGKGYEFVYTGAEPLNFDIRCFIYDDQGKLIVLDDETDEIVLNYSQGSITGALDETVTWNDDEKCYMGTFDFQGFGVYKFQNLVINRSNYVTKAIMAHSITAISKDPMSYVPTQIAPLIYQLGLPDDQRTMSLQLANASSATLEITVTNTEKNESKVFSSLDETYLVTSSTDTVTGITTFTVELPTDGQWVITGARASTVFYKLPNEENGRFYPGGEKAEDWVDLTTVAGWQNDLSTYYLTDVLVTAQNLPTHSSGDFMTVHTFSGMTVKVTNYRGEDLAKVFSRLNIQQAVAVNMTYKLAVADMLYNPSGSGLADITLGGAATYNGVDGYVVPDMIFQVAGRYRPTFTLTIGSTSYTVESAELESVDENLSKLVEVTWNTPTVTISGITPNKTNHSSVYEDLGWKEKKVTSEVTNGGHTATVYVEATAYKWGWVFTGTTITTRPTVTLQIGKAANADTATMTFTTTDNNGTVYMYTSGDDSHNNANIVSTFTWDKGTTTCTRYPGRYDGGDVTRITTAGTLTSNKIVLKYGTISYEFTLGYTITIVNKSP